MHLESTCRRWIASTNFESKFRLCGKRPLSTKRISCNFKTTSSPCTMNGPQYNLEPTCLRWTTSRSFVAKCQLSGQFQGDFLALRSERSALRPGVELPSMNIVQELREEISLCGSSFTTISSPCVVSGQLCTLQSTPSSRRCEMKTQLCGEHSQSTKKNLLRLQDDVDVTFDGPRLGQPPRSAQ